MKYLRQFCIILLVSALGEGLHILLPLPVVLITILTTVIVMVVTGRSTQFVIRKDRGKDKK